MFLVFSKQVYVKENHHILRKQRFQNYSQLQD